MGAARTLLTAAAIGAVTVAGTSCSSTTFTAPSTSRSATSASADTTPPSRSTGEYTPASAATPHRAPAGNPALCDAYRSWLVRSLPGIEIIRDLPADQDPEFSQLTAALPTPVFVSERTSDTEPPTYGACWGSLGSRDAAKVVAAANALGYTEVVAQSSGHPRRFANVNNLVVSGNEREMPGASATADHVSIVGLGGLDVLRPSGSGSLVVGD